MDWYLLVVIFVLLFFAGAVYWWWTQSRIARSTSSGPRSAAEQPPPPYVPEPQPLGLPAPDVPEADDLAAIEGIGPRIHDVLHEAGIKTFAQLAETDVERIREILTSAEFPFAANPETWPAQARLAAQSRWQELKELQESLKSGV